MKLVPSILAFLVASGCGAASDSDDGDDTDVVDTSERAPGERPTEAWDQAVEVTLDGAPAADVLVMQGGASAHVRTDADGKVTLRVDPAIRGSIVVIAADLEARVDGVDVDQPTELVSIALERYNTDGNDAYVFQDPGTPTRSGSTAYCSHCHERQVADWVGSRHEGAASNPIVHDLYSGTADLDEVACGDAGGAWVTGRLPGGGTGDRCRLGVGALPDLNPGCGDAALCDSPAVTGACADCHAPGIDGVLGGRDLLDATGVSHEHGVHCDVCHKIADVDLDAPAGLGGRLQIVRPSEPTGMAGFDFQPITFGPFADVLNPRMGSVYAPIFHEAVLCAGCHQHDQAVLVPGASIDTARWPDGVLPVHSTYEEWLASPMATDTPCQSCHMLPDPDAGNSADLDRRSNPEDLDDPIVGRTGGWWRPAGSSRRHTWPGPRGDDDGALDDPVSLDVQTAVDAGRLTVDVTVQSEVSGHALPTGEPLRAVLLHVAATCSGEALMAVDGDAMPAFAGALAVQGAAGDWSRWPGAEVGQVVRVVRDEGWRDYTGFGPFGDGTFDAEAKGLPDLRAVGWSTISEVSGEGVVTFDRVLPAGDLAFLGDADRPAGAPGMAFARVLVDADGGRMVPHHRAVDVVSDNRLLPDASVTTRHVFDAPCAEPDVTARVVWRRYPAAIAAERGWPAEERIVHTWP